MIAFTKIWKPELMRRIAEARISVHRHTMRFNGEAHRWLEVYVDTGLQSRAQRNLTLENPRKAENRVSQPITTRGLVLELVRQSRF